MQATKAKLHAQMRDDRLARRRGELFEAAKARRCILDHNLAQTSAKVQRHAASKASLALFGILVESQPTHPI